MDRVSKALKKLNAKERRLLKQLLETIQRSGLEGLDVKKLAGQNDIFRIRKGDLRIILRVESGKLTVLTAERRLGKNIPQH